MRYIIFILFLTSFINNLFSQSNSFNTKAKFVDLNNSLFFGNIIALLLSDNSIVKGGYFLNEKAELYDVRAVEALESFLPLNIRVQ